MKAPRRRVPLSSLAQQGLLLLLVLGAGWYLAANFIANRSASGITIGFGFLDREAGFAIGESLLAYRPNDSYARAFLVGIVNTLRVAALGIVLATVLGALIGIARLSSNWLLAKLAAAYVEIVRNVPLIVQLLFWVGVIRISAPPPRRALNPLAGVFINNRGVQLPALKDEALLVLSVSLLVGAIASLAVWAWARRRQAATGRRFPTPVASLCLLVALPAIAILATGTPIGFDLPALAGFNFVGGWQLSPEFAALVIGLTLYTAGFIAEIVRSGITAVAPGQSEAARALGLRPGRILALIVLPQALRIIIPPTTSQYLNLVKNSSLGVVIGYPDLVSIGNTAANQTGQAVEAISIYMAVYLMISLTISAAMNLYNRAIALKER